MLKSHENDYLKEIDDLKMSRRRYKLLLEN